MRLARVSKDGEEIAVYIDERGDAYPIFGMDLAAGRDRLKDTLPVITLDRKQLQQFEARVRSQIALKARHAVVPDEWLPPIARPSKVIGVAMNNSAFAPASFRYFETPSYFMKAPSALIGSGQPIVLREEYGLTHPEAELACVIARRSSNLSESEAKDVIFGYTILNDVTSVGLKDEDSLHLEFSKANPGQGPADWRRQRDETDWDIYLTYHLRSKCTDTFGPIGPWITSADDVPDPDRLAIKAWLGERLIAEDSTAQLTFPVAKVLAHVSRYVTLEAGDIVHFGTAVDPKRFALREANLLTDPAEVRIEIEGLGVLTNPTRLIET